jgi:hypothetical protein
MRIHVLSVRAILQDVSATNALAAVRSSHQDIESQVLNEAAGKARLPLLCDHPELGITE